MEWFQATHHLMDGSKQWGQSGFQNVILFMRNQIFMYIRLREKNQAPLYASGENLFTPKVRKEFSGKMVCFFVQLASH